MIALDRLEQIGARARRILDINRAALDTLFHSRRDLAAFFGPWGTIAFPRLRHGRGDEFFELLHSRYETNVVPGRFFEMPDHFRIGIGGDPAMTAEGLQRLSAALDEYGAARE